MSRNALFATAIICVICGAIFAIWPGIDLWASRLFYSGQEFTGNSPAGRALRRFFYYGPFVIPLTMAALWIAARLGANIPDVLRPSGRSLVFVFGTLAIAPGIMVNLGLKEYSGRPRPVHVTEFGSASEFRPWNRFGGACASNCSFVSGEVSTAAWLAAPAALAPAAWRVPAMGAALIVAAATGFLRMSFGAHFLSDVLFAILLTLLVVQLAYLLIFRPSAKR